MAQTKEDLQALFGEGVSYTIEERWIHPDEIEDATLRVMVEDAFDFLDAFRQRCHDIDSYIYQEG